jgi:RimJ/RimL family protein N-acetyltransferase
MVILRKVTLADAKVLHRWRNDPATMAAEGQADSCRLRNMRSGSRATIGGPEGRHLYLAFWRHLTIGTGRIDTLNETAWLSWTIAPEHRGHGFTRRLIRSLVQEAQLLGYRNLGAKIRATNPIALRLAQECRELSVIWVLP